jgi:hypothetical protein
MRVHLQRLRGTVFCCYINIKRKNLSGVSYVGFILGNSQSSYIYVLKRTMDTEM